VRSARTTRSRPPHRPLRGHRARGRAARELEARRFARLGNVVTLDADAKRVRVSARLARERPRPGA
jgi:hypothetical protein